MKTFTIIGRVIRIIFIVFLFLIIIGNALSGSFRSKRKGTEAEVISSCHTIQIALEDYARDNGEYPAFLLGGDKEGWDYYNDHRPEGTPYLIDPLIESGHLISYPENLFALRTSPKRDRKVLKGFIERVRADGNNTFDPRFGLNGDKMGNVLLEPFLFVEQRDEDLKGYPRMCPGQFYYRAYGGIKSIEDLEGIEIDNPDEYEPDFYGHYILGAFGSIDTTGHDSIRWKDLDGYLPTEFPYISPDDYYQSSTGVATEIHLRLPEVVGSEYYYTPPVWPPLDDNLRNLIIGAPDGSEDGVIITLTGIWMEWKYTARG